MFYDNNNNLVVGICKTKLQKDCAIISIDENIFLSIYFGVNTDEKKININELVNKLLENGDLWEFANNRFGTIDNLKINEVMK